MEAPRVGIFSLLDEACATVGQVTDEIFLEALNKQLASHKYFDSKEKNHTDRSMNFKENFRITHYAGDVVYSVKGFIGEKRDKIPNIGLSYDQRNSYSFHISKYRKNKSIQTLLNSKINQKLKILCTPPINVGVGILT